MTALTLEVLASAVAGDVAAFRAISRLQPAGGPGDKVFPSTYAVSNGVKYAIEQRRIDGQSVKTVLLDSVASQANRLELALRDAWERGEITLPIISVDFSTFEDLADLGRITVLDAPHRIADAIFRDSELDGTAFRMSTVGRAFTEATSKAATPVFVYCPSALVFGVWDSTGPKGGLGAKYARALSSEIVGIGAEVGVKTGSRIDPLAISKHVEVYAQADDNAEWTANAELAQKDRKGNPVAHGGKGDTRPSTVNHGNVAPSIDSDAGGVTIDYALQTTVLSLPALRRLRFPRAADGTALSGAQRLKAENAAHTALAALGIAAMVFARRDGYDLRSRCALVAESPFTLEAVPSDGSAPTSYSLDTAGAAKLLQDASAAARAAGMGWHDDEIRLAPATRLVDLVRRSREKHIELAAAEGEAE